MAALSSLRKTITRAVTGLVRKFDQNWFLNFLKIAAGEDSNSFTKVGDPMKQHAWVATAIDFRADNLARAPWKIMRGDTEIVSGPVWKLFRNVNPTMSSFQLFAATEAWLGYKGEAFWIYDLDAQKQGGTGNIPKSIWVVPPRMMTHSIDPNTLEVSMWKFQPDGTEEAIPLVAREVVHFKQWNPWDAYRGVGRIISTQREISIDVSAQTTNLATLRNGSIPEGILTSEQHVTREDAQEVKERWEQQHRGSSRSHKLSVLGQGWSYDRIQLTPQDMEFNQMQRWDRSTILARLGVPAVLIGATDDRTPLSGSDTKSQQQNFWNTTLTPETMLIERKVDTDFFQRFKLDGMTGILDKSEIPELQQDEDAIHARAREDVKSGLLTINEGRLAIGQETDVEGGDVTMVPMNMIPLTTAQTDEVAEIPTTTTVSIEAPAFAGLLSGPIDLSGLPLVGNGFIVDDRKAPYTYEYKTAHWKAVIRRWNAAEKEYREELREWFFRQRSVLLETLTSKNVSDEMREELNNPLFWSTENAKLEVFSRRIFTLAAAGAEAELISLFEAIGVDIGVDWTIFDVGATKLIGERVNQIKDITATMRGQVDDVMRQAIEGGLSEVDTAELLRSKYQFAASRAKTIARTEVGNVIQDSRNAAYESVGVKSTEWLSARDAKVRAGHDIDGEIVPLGEVFSNGLAYPNDPAGDAGNVINCRCLTVPVEAT